MPYPAMGGAQGPQGAQGNQGNQGNQGFQGSGATPVGAIVVFPVDPGAGWLRTDGTAVSRATYAALFAIIGSTFGAGDGSTTFNLPNTKGRVIVDFNSSDTEFDTVGETGGAKTHTLSTAELAAHAHPIFPGTSTQHADDSGFGVFMQPPTQAGGNSSNAGGGGAHNNLQPYIALLHYIKT